MKVQLDYYFCLYIGHEEFQHFKLCRKCDVIYRNSIRLSLDHIDDKIITSFKINVLRFRSDVQTTLVRSSWGQLFTLGLAQCAYTLSLPSILTSIINHLQASIAQEKVTAGKVKCVTEHIWRLQDCVNSLHKLQVDSVEYAYLKALTLFSAGK